MAQHKQIKHRLMKTVPGQVKCLDKTSRRAQKVYEKVNHIPFLPAPRRYNLTLSHSRRFIWFRVAKVGTRTILNHLKQSNISLEVQDVSQVYYPPKLYADYFKFAFVRNPWDRLVSCWLDKVVKHNMYRFKEGDREKMRQFENFVDYVAGLDIENCDRHLQLQSRLIDLNHVNYIGRLETFEADLNQVCKMIGVKGDAISRKNTSAKRQPYQDYYSPAIQAKVAQIYQTDIQLFGYQFE
ncbi:sulfotransferase family 2 domain-containing protein [Romeria aff. gracilis LEGE 07310]|uniref:Sulfotransferase family 2 domain-containing protein n=1 Tax=Vasconcelosia minhoensis LEGE 07310 TaxID=915328 RepID=A0A8J7AT73_9CYAN|nr:sulfotransferase family protein [Romeria gracilis]MBE9080431.1 sulfotransferase family 2 domain-containing protein [Romeria aff. gracilis LEGE 07310]